MVGVAVGQVDIGVGVVGLLDTGVHFCAVEQAAEAVELGDIDKFPLHELLFVVVEAILFFFADGPGLFERFVFIVGGDQAELLVELRGMPTFAADDRGK